MNCKDFENTIHELVTRRTAGATKQLEAFEHAGHCLWCALRLDEETRLTEKLRAFAGALQFQRAPARVEEELLRAFREKNSAESTVLLGIAGKRLRQALSWGLAFAATVAAAWILIFLWPHFHSGASDHPPRVDNHRPPAASEPSRTNVAPVTRAALSARAALKGATPQVAYAWTLERTALGESASELPGDFISLGTCDDSLCMDEATLVRVSLPAEALLAFGLGTGNDYSPEGSVQADVVLGSDGVPFAIRFVD
jgi:hypothetical protein